MKYSFSPNFSASPKNNTCWSGKKNLKEIRVTVSGAMVPDPDICYRVVRYFKESVKKILNSEAALAMLD
jgi:hypothetical protein